MFVLNGLLTILRVEFCFDIFKTYSCVYLHLINKNKCQKEIENVNFCMI